MTNSFLPAIRCYHHGRFRVAGGVLPDAITAYQTFGEKSNPCIVLPTYYGGKLDSKYTGSWCALAACVSVLMRYWVLDLMYMIGENKVSITLNRQRI